MGRSCQTSGTLQAGGVPVDTRTVSRGGAPTALGGLLALTCAFGVASGPAAAEDPVSFAQARASALRAELADLRSQAARAVADYELAETALTAAVLTSVALSRDVDTARATADAVGAQADRRAVALYRTGTQNGMLRMLTRAGSPEDLVRRTRDLRAVLAADSGIRVAAAAARHDVEVREARAAEVAASRVHLSGRLVQEQARLDSALRGQQDRLSSADDEVLRLVEQQRAEERRAAVAALLVEQQAARAPAQIGALPGTVVSAPYSGPDGTCPVGPVHSFTDTWHAARSGGRQHQGTDVFAPKGSNSYAVRDGVIDKVGSGGLGGISLWLRTDSGDRFYYAHHDAEFVTVGQRVRAGQVLGHVGNTGNAETTPSHVHFEAHPGGGAAVNPYPWLAAICAG